MATPSPGCSITVRVDAPTDHAADLPLGHIPVGTAIPAFPAFVRGLLDAGRCDLTETMLIAAARAIADQVAPHELDASSIVPSVVDPAVAGAVTEAVRSAPFA